VRLAAAQHDQALCFEPLKNGSTFGELESSLAATLEMLNQPFPGIPVRLGPRGGPGDTHLPRRPGTNAPTTTMIGVPGQVPGLTPRMVKERHAEHLDFLRRTIRPSACGDDTFRPVVAVGSRPIRLHHRVYEGNLQSRGIWQARARSLPRDGPAPLTVTWPDRPGGACR
jgi:hypothetical protein